MAITVLDVKSASGQATALQLAAFATNPATGDLIVVAIGVYNLVGSINAPTDTAGNTYTRLGSVITSGVSTGTLYAAPNITGGSSFRVTVHFSSSVHFAAVAWAVTGVDATPFNSDWVSATGATGAIAVVATVPPPRSSLYLGVVSLGGATTPTDGASWNTTGVNGVTAAMVTAAKVPDYVAHFDAFTEYQVAATIQSASWTQAGTLPWVAMQASFASSAGGGVPERVQITLVGPV